MQHRDKVIIDKILSEINIGCDMLNSSSLQEFEDDEKLKRAVSMTVINIGELIKNITDETRKNILRYPGKQ